ncbi:type IV pilus assembly protein PilM [Cryobacterium melibiosiphilum]|uniref:Type IV pilus assembly protein PilM n=1 Tax=Cryobacterium melibiosiphilum TaxID=995039 RepID=A0A3A5MEE7_9MICO|nr:type IV pilus assembly protein PilM [Cryobacterium melibiosiphilum]RJT88510.1 type IV pilus assembly protein PilM [Cryobacterium melibiosiphilum]
MNTSVVGLDIGFSSVRAVEVSEAGSAKPTIQRYHEEPLPAGAVSRGEVLEPAIVASALKRLWSAGGFKSRDVVLGMGNHRVVARDLTVPKMSMKRIRESLPFQVQDLLSVPVAEALLDFYTIMEVAGDEAGPQVSGLLIAAVKDVVLANVKSVQLAGLTPVEVDLIPFALSRAIHRGAATDDVIVQIDVGAGTTSVLITAAGIPQFVRLIPAGGDDVTQALMVRLALDAQPADALKLTLGLDPVAHEAETGRSAETLAAATLVHDVTTELLNSLRNTVNYFTNTRHTLTVTRIVLTGGGARLDGFREALAGLTRLPVEAPDPVGAVHLARGLHAEGLQRSGGTYLVALGLALGSKG